MSHFLASLDQLECEYLTMLLHQGLDSDAEHVKLFLLHFGKKIKQLHVHSDKLVRAGEDGIFAKIHSIFIDLQALLGGRYHEGVLGALWLRLGL